MMQIVYTMHSLARMLQVSTRTLRREIEDGKLHFVKIRGRMRFRQEDVQEYLRNCTDNAASLPAPVRKAVGPAQVEALPVRWRSRGEQN